MNSITAEANSLATEEENLSRTVRNDVRDVQMCPVSWLYRRGSTGEHGGEMPLRPTPSNVIMCQGGCWWSSHYVEQEALQGPHNRATSEAPDQKWTNEFYKNTSPTSRSFCRLTVNIKYKRC